MWEVGPGESGVFGALGLQQVRVKTQGQTKSSIQGAQKGTCDFQRKNAMKFQFFAKEEKKIVDGNKKNKERGETQKKEKGNHRRFSFRKKRMYPPPFAPVWKKSQG